MTLRTITFDDEQWQVVPKQLTPEMLGAALWPACLSTDYALALAAAPEPQVCFCDEKGIGDPANSCGDCPQDYGIPTVRANPEPPAQQPMTDAATDVLAERRRQVEAEGWTPEHDDEHARGEIALAAACYALSAVGVRGGDAAQLRFWPWDDDWWRPSTPRRDLIKAGALILAEIERLDRAGIGKGESNA